MSVGVFNAEAQRRRGSRRASGARDSSEPSRAQASAERGEVKASGVGWLGDVPEGWKCRKVFGLFTENSTKNTQLLFRRAMQFNYGTIVDKNESFETEDVKEIYSRYTVLKSGDIVINGLNLNYDLVSQRVAIAPKDGIITSAYIAITARDNVCPEYYCYLFKAMDSKKMFHGMGTGVRLTLSFKELRNVVLPFPPLPEQEAIVKYLDEATGKIDKAIEAEEKMVALLQERREIVINEAVGGGQDFNAETQRRGVRRDVKPSGIAWLGDIPKVWDVKYGKCIFVENTLKNRANDDKTVLSLSYGKIIVKKSIDEGLVPEEYSSYQVLSPGDIVVRCTDLQNDQTSLRIGFVENDGIITSAYLGLKVNEGYSPRFIFYFLHAWDVSKEIYRYGSGLRQSLSWEDFKYLPIVVPPLPEQEAIVKRLDEETGKIDRAIAVKRRQIELLRERREIIINEVVTGKVKVA